MAFTTFDDKVMINNVMLTMLQHTRYTVYNDNGVQIYLS